MVSGDHYESEFSAVDPEHYGPDNRAIGNARRAQTIEEIKAFAAGLEEGDVVFLAVYKEKENETHLLFDGHGAEALDALEMLSRARDMTHATMKEILKAAADNDGERG